MCDLRKLVVVKLLELNRLFEVRGGKKKNRGEVVTIWQDKTIMQVIQNKVIALCRSAFMNEDQRNNLLSCKIL